MGNLLLFPSENLDNYSPKNRYRANEHEIPPDLHHQISRYTAGTILSSLPVRPSATGRLIY
jgi:hypothetical protein